MKFENFIGNKNVKAAVMAAFAKDRLPQAIIIEGDEGTGKRTFAKLIATAAVCNNDDKPCGHCKGCIMAKAGSHPDIKTYVGTGETASISVDTVRNIISDASNKPEQSDLNIYLLFVKNAISSSSQNKLLKVIEEPPGNALFIITINTAQSLLPTIISRATTYQLKPVDYNKATTYIQENKNMSYDEAYELATIHGGNIGRMLSGSSKSAEIAIEIAKNFDNKNHNAVLAITYDLIYNKELFVSTLKHLSLIFRDAYNYNLGQGVCLGISMSEAKRISTAYRKKILIEFPVICLEYSNLVQKNINMNLLVTDFCAKLRSKALG